jgi:cell division FtsZ-interacting protein ZapD
MKLRDLVNGLDIPERKLVEYALNPDNDRGQHKAKIFAHVLGYTRENYASLLHQIREQAMDAEAVLGEIDRFGQRLRTDLTIRGINEQVAVVCIGWIIPPQSQRARLVTLYVV